MFILLGTAVNSLAVLAGGGLGLLFGKAIPKRLAESIFAALGLCTAYIGITGLFQDGAKLLVIIIAMVIGTLIGEGLNLDSRINAVGKRLENRFQKEGETKSISQGFVSSSLLFCTGAMAVIGSLQSGLLNNHTTLLTKSVIDCVAAMIYASSLGVGVLFSAGAIFIYQGLITLSAFALSGVFADSAAEQLTAAASELTPFMTVVNNMNAVGYLIITALALNMLGITKFRVMNFTPAIFLPIALVPLISLLPI